MVVKAVFDHLDATRLGIPLIPHAHYYLLEEAAGRRFYQQVRHTDGWVVALVFDFDESLEVDAFHRSELELAYLEIHCGVPLLAAGLLRVCFHQVRVSPYYHREHGHCKMVYHCSQRIL